MKVMHELIQTVAILLVVSALIGANAPTTPISESGLSKAVHFQMVVLQITQDRRL